MSVSVSVPLLLSPKRFLAIVAATLLLAGAALVTRPLPAQADYAAVTVYRYPGFGGPGLTFNRPVWNLESEGINDQITSVIVRAGAWRFCDGANLHGPCITLGPGSYPNLGPWGMNSRISSIAPVGWSGPPDEYPPPNYGNGYNPPPASSYHPPPGGYRPPLPPSGYYPPPYGGGYGDITLYEDDGFRGQQYTFSSEVRNLENVGFNDKASSVVIRAGRWLLCDGANFRPPCITLGPGSYRRLSELGMNDVISSLRRY